MDDRLIPTAIVVAVGAVLYALLSLAQRACLRRSRRHQWYADWYARAARSCSQMVAWHAARAERVTGPRTRAFYRMMTERLPKDAAEHEVTSKRHLLRAQFWDFMA
jgi:hypothetical protein